MNNNIINVGIIDMSLWENRKSDPESIEREFKGDKGRGWLLRWLPSRAHDNGVFYIFSNGVGKDDESSNRKCNDHRYLWENPV